tara:strand:- start:2343 stop:3131 length:789 start_codon:yes stop_codon:yes gene_type:complete
MTIPSGPYIPLPDNTEIIKQRVQTTALNTLKLNDSELGGSGEVVTIQSLNGTIEVSSTTIGTDSLVLTSAMQAALTSKQDAAAFLTTLVGIGGTSGSGNLARVTSPTFVTPTLGTAAATQINLSGADATTNSILTSASGGILFARAGNGSWIYPGDGRYQMRSDGFVGWTSGTNPVSGLDSNISRQSAGVVQIGTTAANALGSLVCATVTAGLAATPATFAVVNATTATVTLGLRRITDRSNRLAYPDGTNWRFISDDAIIS